MTTETTTFVAPAAFLKSKGIKLTVGQEVDYTAMGLAPPPLHGPVPVVTVTAVKEDGSLLTGTIHCGGLDAPCAELVVVHAGDVFQKRRCTAHQKVFANRRHRPAVDPAVKEAKAAEAKAKAELKVKAAEEKKALAAKAKAEAAEKKAAEKLLKAEVKAAAKKGTANDNKNVSSEQKTLVDVTGNTIKGRTAAELVKSSQ
jgi:hypothetical protein